MIAPKERFAPDLHDEHVMSGCGYESRNQELDCCFFPQAKVFEVSLDILESASMIARSTLTCAQVRFGQSGVPSVWEPTSHLSVIPKLW